MVRAAPPPDGVTPWQADLAHPESLATLPRVDAVVHAAAIVSTARPDPLLSRRVNVEGTGALLARAAAAGVARWVQISSMSAHPDNRSVYGKTKLMADELVARGPIPAVLLRPSIVYTAERRGIFWKLVRTVARSPVVPLPGGGAEPMRPIHAADVAAAAVAAVERPAARGIYELGGPEEISFRRMVEDIRAALGMAPRVVTLPMGLARLAAMVGERLLSNPPLTTDNLAGIARARHCDPSRAVAELGLSARPWERGLAECVAQWPELSRLTPQ
jgi:NADH dehydrogenase